MPRPDPARPGHPRPARSPRRPPARLPRRRSAGAPAGGAGRVHLLRLRPQPAEQAARPPGQITDGQGRTAGWAPAASSGQAYRGLPSRSKRPSTSQVMVRSLVAADLGEEREVRRAVAENDRLIVRVDCCYMVTAPPGTQRGGRSPGHTCDDEAVRIVSPALPGHLRVASPSGRPQLDDGAKCAATPQGCSPPSPRRPRPEPSTGCSWSDSPSPRSSPPHCRWQAAPRPAAPARPSPRPPPPATAPSSSARSLSACSPRPTSLRLALALLVVTSLAIAGLAIRWQTASIPPG